MSRARVGRHFVVVMVAVGLVVAAATAIAQQMPDPKQMSGIPRPVTDLPDGSLSVRLIKGDLSNNIAGHPVELKVGDRTLTVKTDEGGRAQFDRLPSGVTVKASAVVDGERLESQEFPSPSSGGIRLMLVATDREREARAAAEASAPAVPGLVVIGGESRIVFEPAEDSVAVFYVLEILNNTRTPVMPAAPFVFDMPGEMVGTSVAQGSSPLASNSGERVSVTGPFPPGKTLVEVGGSIPVRAGTIEFTQTFPATFEQPVFIAKREGTLRITSPQFDRIQEINADNGTPIIAGAANALPAGRPLQFTLTGLPYYSATPRRTALALAAVIILVGVVFGFRTPSADGVDADVERRKLLGRREKLFADLLKLEHDHRSGRIDAPKYRSRREALVDGLQQVYASLSDEAA